MAKDHQTMKYHFERCVTKHSSKLSNFEKQWHVWKTSITGALYIPFTTTCICITCITHSCVDVNGW